MNKVLFQETADVYGIDFPALVEKDYYLIELLKSLQTITLENYDLIFTGGTCLTKAHIETNRFSEDIDFKITPHESLLSSSRAQRKKTKKTIYEQVTELINSLTNFKIINKSARNEYGLQLFELSYPSQFNIPSFIRPCIKLELFESRRFKQGQNHKVRSLVNAASQKEPEISAIYCSPVNVIAAEKLVSLLRRTSAEIRGVDQNPDHTLIRHAYDLNLIFKKIDIKGTIFNLIPLVIQNDVEQFGNKNKIFKEDPISEMKIALEFIIESEIFANRYEMFLNPLVYDTKPPAWDEIKNLLTLIGKQFLK